MVVTYVNLSRFEEFDKYTQSIDPAGPPVLFYFSGAKTQDGKSWCPDCVEVTDLTNSMTMPNKKPKITLHTLNNFEEFNEFTEKLTEKNKNVYFFFSGKKKENGRSWCIYCQMAEPIVKSYLGELEKDVIFAYVDVGDITYWRDKACPFRTDPRIKLMVIPTIIKWKGVQRLEGGQCAKRELLQMLFEDEE